MVKVVFFRHGQSQWNLENKFTGWGDVDRTEGGVLESRLAGRLLNTKGYTFDLAFTSVLTRAIRSLWIVLEELGQTWIPVAKDWQLNERHYGALQGLSKSEMTRKHGAEQVHIWRRSYTVRPPTLSERDPRHPRFDPRYRGLDQDSLPATESLEDTLKRVIPYWERTIVPLMLQEKEILISAHGNSLRALIKHLQGISDAEITKLEIPTGLPLVYEFDDKLNVHSHYYLADPADYQQAIEDDERKKEMADT